MHIILVASRNKRPVPGYHKIAPQHEVGTYRPILCKLLNYLPAEYFGICLHHTNKLRTHLHCSFCRLIGGEPTIKQEIILRPPFYILLTYPLCFFHHPLGTLRSGSKLLLVTAVLYPSIPPLKFYEEQVPCYRAGNFLEIDTQGLRLAEYI